MRRLNEVWKKEEFIKAVKESFTIADVLRRLGKKVNSCGFYKVVHRDIKRFGLDTSHWLGRAHANRESNIRAAAIRSIPLSELLVKDCFHTPKGFKNRLLRANLLPYVCKLCGLNEWQGKSICLQLDHENGVNDDNRLENLRLLCPNCHSQTDTYCGRNNKVGRNVSGSLRIYTVLGASEAFSILQSRMSASVGPPIQLVYHGVPPFTCFGPGSSARYF